MKKLTVFSIIIMILSFSSCSEKEKKVYCPTENKIRIIGTPNNTGADLYVIGTTHAYNDEYETTGTIYNDGGLIYEAFYLINLHKTQKNKLEIWTEGIPEGEIGNRKNRKMINVIPLCVSQKFGYKKVKGLDNRHKSPKAYEIYNKANLLFIDLLEIKYNFDYTFEAKFKRQPTQEELSWIRNVWYENIIKQDIILEKSIKRKKGVVICGTYHAIKIYASGRVKGIYITSDNKTYQKAFGQFIVDSFVCTNILKESIF